MVTIIIKPVFCLGQPGLLPLAMLGGKGHVRGTVPLFSEIIKIQFQNSFFFNILKGPMKMFTIRPSLKCNLSGASPIIGEWP